jgi:hypothetical protein
MTYGIIDASPDTIQSACLSIGAAGGRSSRVNGETVLCCIPELP